ncbi:peptide MFS transporter [Bacteroidales bacterium OttesenSCG-928-K03]|nr:peptide MFS transporter [Odoribacter sp. OttesenSCG-928-L07]MDL2238745.1 peptide MFS transporter [Bacteroidales bacterium OttesenSCG-928-L14]MDL2240855.1 peptide MFS transporter [Bacteroidales bacterium OttesenSCG-928-K22]MDL2242794.1 peptide MFS transporter [Bacteroidales bacterium OttesenSCG-928-K03]
MLSDFIQNHRTFAILLAILIIVIPFVIYYVTKAKKEHPKGLIAAALSNMGERFGYYIMNAVLLLFICSKFGISDEAAGWIYAVFYFLIYILSLPGGIIADRLQNYKGTIMSGLIVMALGYGLLSIPLFGNSAAGYSATTGILVFTCAALLLIAFGNGLFKGNLQAIVGQMYDNFEAEAAKKGEEELKKVKGRRDSGFQIFYVFINVGGVIAPFVAPLLRSWWLNTKDLVYNADLPRLCHQFLDSSSTMTATDMSNLETLSQSVQMTGFQFTDMAAFCSSYLETFNTGVHYSFLASVAAMLISFTIFLLVKKRFPNPVKKAKAAVIEYTPEEKIANAKEIRQRMYALFAVLGIAIFFWFSFHQNGQSLSVFARDFVQTGSIAPEIWQCINPFFVIILTPMIIMLFGALTKRGKEVSTPRKIAIGMFIAACAYIFLMIVAIAHNYPSGDEFKGLADAAKEAMKSSPYVLIVTYFFLTVAELFISPLGLSFVSKVAPKHLQGICQGLWLSATAIGNLFIALGVTMLNKFPHQWQCWAVFAAFCLISMIVMLSMVKWLEKVTK